MKCECSCGKEVNSRNRFVKGYYWKVKSVPWLGSKRSSATRAMKPKKRIWSSVLKQVKSKGLVKSSS